MNQHYRLRRIINMDNASLVGKISLCLLVFSILFTACDLLNLGDASDKDQVLRILDDAIGTLNRTPGNFETVLTDTVTLLERAGTNLAEEIAGEVNDLMVTGVGLVQNTIDCGFDKVGVRIKDSLQQIRNAIAGEEPPIPSPWICFIDPPVIKYKFIDYKWMPEEKSSPIKVYGINFLHDENKPKIEWKKNDGTKIDISERVVVTTNYLLQINLDGFTLEEDPTFTEFVVRWPTIAEPNSIPVSPVPTPAPLPKEKCRTEVVQYSLGTVELYPLRISGDNEFNGMGPIITVDIEIWVNYLTNKLEGNLFMKAEEDCDRYCENLFFDWMCQCDPTIAEANRALSFNYAPNQAGFKINRILTNTSEHFYYEFPVDIIPDPYVEDREGLVSQFEVWGDSFGEDVKEDVNQYTKVKVFFREANIEILQVENCEP